MRSLVTWLALMLASSAVAQEPEEAEAPRAAAERLEGPVPDEVDAFREAQKRFSARMAELESDTREFVEFRQEEERQKLTAGYDRLLNELRDVEGAQRTVTVQKLEDFLAKYPDAPYSSHVRFRLADLYYEVEFENWLSAVEAYESGQENLTLEQLEELGEMEEPELDLSRPIALYKRIIADNKDLPEDERYERLDAAYIMLAFCYVESNAGQYDLDAAKATFQEVIEVIPDSDLADRSHLFLGNFLFDDGEFDAAIAEYTLVYNKGEESPYYIDSIYQLAWAQYKQSNYDDALEKFTRVLDLSDERRKEKGKGTGFEPDSIRFMAFSFADMAEAGDATPVEHAKRFFSKTGERKWEREVYIQLTDVLIRYQRTEEVLDVFKYLQDEPRWVHEPDNPDYQWEIIRFLEQDPIIRDLEKAGAERILLTERYNQGGEWWNANRNNPEALNKARSYIEKSLVNIAREYYVRAQETGDTADYAVAATKYGEYLDKFPISDDYYEQQWFFAYALLKAQDFEAAEKEFSSLIRARRYHQYGDGALFFTMEVRRQLADAKLGAPDKRPENAPLERTYQNQDGEDINVYSLLPEHVAFIEAADMVVAHKFSAPADPDTPDFKAAAEANRVALLYLPAQILYYHNRFDEARERFERIINEHPRTNEASYAAGLIVDSFLAEGDLDAVRQYTTRFASMILGESDIPDPDGKFAETLEGTAFKMAKAHADAGDLAAAADAFLEYMTEFPQGRYVEDALYNAAFFHQEIGKAEKSNQLYEEYVNKYPDSDRSRTLYFRIAANYEKTFELEQAVFYYDQLVKKFPEHTDAANALYNSSFLRVGLRRYEEAAKGYERYADEHPDLADAEEVYFRAGEQWEEVSDTKALAFYGRYLKKYGNEEPDHAIQAEYRIAEIYNKQGKKSAYQRQLDKVLERFDAIIASGETVGVTGMGYAGEAAFRDLEKSFETYTADTLPKDEEKTAKLLTETKPAELKEVEAELKAYIGRYKNFEWQTKAMLLFAKVPLYLADLGLAVEPPKGISEDEEVLYWEILEEQFFPQFYALEDVGIQRLNEMIDVGKSQKKHSESITQAFQELNKRRPADYPALKVEQMGAIDTSAPSEVKPLTREDLEQKFPVKAEEAEESPSPEEQEAQPEAPEEGTPEETPTPEAPSEGGE